MLNAYTTSVIAVTNSMIEPTLRNALSVAWLFFGDSGWARLAPPAAARAMPLLTRRWRTSWIMKEILRSRSGMRCSLCSC